MLFILFQIKGQLNLSSIEFQDLSRQLKRSRNIIQILEKVTAIHDAVQAMRNDRTQHRFVDAIQSMKDAQNVLSQDALPRETEIKILTVLASAYKAEKRQLEGDVADAWREKVQWVLPSQTVSNQKSQVEINISTDKDGLKDIVRALGMLGLLLPKVQQFGERFIEHVAQPILHDKSAGHEVSTTASTHTLTVRTTVGKTDRVPPQIVLTAFEEILKFLHMHLFSVPIDKAIGLKLESDGEVSEGESRTSSEEPLMRMLAEATILRVNSLIIDECLTHSIPSQQEDLKSYEEVIALTDNFEEKLAKIQYVGRDSTHGQSLCDFVGNVGMLFANKKCQEILAKARELMHTSLQQMVPALEDESPPPLELQGSLAKKSKKGESGSLPSSTPLSSNIFKMPQCKIRSV